MKRFIFLIVLAVFFMTASAQKVYFMYLQAEPAQPFFLKLNGKVHSSSASGYLILSRLADTSYTITIGFIKPGIREQVFTVRMEQKDHGFLLKDFGEKGWGLFDLQRLTVQYSETVPVNGQQQATAGKQVSPFTDLLSKATGDPSLRENPPAPKVEEVKPEVKPAIVVVEPTKAEPQKSVSADEPKQVAVTPAEVTPRLITEKKEEVSPVKTEPVLAKAETVADNKEEKKEDKVIAVKEQEIKAPVVPDTVTKATVIPPLVNETKKEEPKLAPDQEQVIPVENIPEKTETVTEVVYKNSVVTKRSESSTTEGFGLVFIDTWEGGKIDTIRLLIPNPKQVVALVKETPKVEKKFLEIQATATKPEEKNPVAEEKQKQAEPLKPVADEKAEVQPVVPASRQIKRWLQLPVRRQLQRPISLPFVNQWRLPKGMRI
ncbi:MAG: hypothetical protein IPM91_05895 [Bacteroidetes bacterium]|nr:hypothetical protein [Bacteroidota bacterium]